MNTQDHAPNKWDPNHRWDLRVDYLCREDRKHLSTHELPNSPSQFQEGLEKCLAEARARNQWADYLRYGNSGDLSGPYRVSHAGLLARAKYYPPAAELGKRVTDFSGWVFDLYMGRDDPDAKAQGKRVERDIRHRLSPLPSLPEWELIYRDPLTERPEPLRASCLRIGGDCIWGAPDYVYRHRKNGEVIIIDRKASDRNIPCNGWPNLRAQLWAYSMIDAWRDAPKIHLIGDVWTLWRLNPTHRAILYWDAEDMTLQAQNRQLFEAYGGSVSDA